MIVTLAPEGEEELIEGASYYARESGPELGYAFIDEFQRSAEVLRAHPTLGAIWRGPIRRLPLRRFPYSIVYTLHGEEIKIFALAHQRRRPGYWRGRT